MEKAIKYRAKDSLKLIILELLTFTVRLLRGDPRSIGVTCDDTRTMKTVPFVTCQVTDGAKVRHCSVRTHFASVASVLWTGQMVTSRQFWRKPKKYMRNTDMVAVDHPVNIAKCSYQ